MKMIEFHENTKIETVFLIVNVMKDATITKQRSILAKKIVLNECLLSASRVYWDYCSRDMVPDHLWSVIKYACCDSQNSLLVIENLASLNIYTLLTLNRC